MATHCGIARTTRTTATHQRLTSRSLPSTNKFVPHRIVIDYHKGNRNAKPEMFFDFRFKVYEPCLWLFDRSIVEGKEPPVRIDDVIVAGKPGVDMAK